MPVRETVAVYCENHMEHRHTVWAVTSVIAASEGRCRCPTSLAVHAVSPPALGGPRASTASVVVDEPRWAGQHVGHSVHAVEELVAHLRVRVPKVAVGTWTALAGLRVLCDRNQVRHNADHITVRPVGLWELPKTAKSIFLKFSYLGGILLTSVYTLQFHKKTCTFRP
jgi:hypothetical protein